MCSCTTKKFHALRERHHGWTTQRSTRLLEMDTNMLTQIVATTKRLVTAFVRTPMS